MSKHAGILQPEIYAIDTAFFNFESNYRGQKIAILTDNQAGIKAGNKVWDSPGYSDKGMP